MITIQNNFLKAGIKTKGAELASLYNIQKKQEYMWGGDPQFWGKHSPVLFPVVGTLKDNSYHYNGQSYKLSRHGFAREMEFEVADQQPDSVKMLLKNSPETEKNYPFKFDFYIIYKLEAATLSVTYKVENAGEEAMWFSVGAHPAFKLPLFPGTSYDEYLLEFSQNEHLERWPISKDGLIEATEENLFGDSKLIPLSKSLFYKDALVFKNMKSDKLVLRHVNGEIGFTFNFPGFPYLGIWAAKDADFVCIEPWCGIADSVNSNQQFTEKEGIHQLAANRVFERTWSVTL